ncbi:g7325 [Coccomyxa viridis]|uniref:G7325 protein n=1 Tax=Coccomyxa viridis TaxID=1274662 RepID=A0ABP1FXK2_9CHLO
MLNAIMAQQLDMEEMVSLCEDAFLSAHGCNAIMSLSFMQDETPEAFWKLMENAVRFGMRKIQECCEYYIAHDTTGRYCKV